MWYINKYLCDTEVAMESQLQVQTRREYKWESQKHSSTGNIS